MARTAAQILQEMADFQASFPQLDTLNSTSQVAIHKLFKELIARVAESSENIVDAGVSDLQSIAAANVPFTPSYYAERALAYQDGDLAVIVDGRVTYPTIDPTKQVVKRVAVLNDPTPGTVLFKVATESAGVPAPLSVAQQAGLESYLNQIIALGTVPNLRSVAGDVLQLSATLDYSPQIPAGTVETNVKQAAVNYIRSISAVDLTGLYEQIRLIDAIQAVQAVRDVYNLSVTITPSVGIPANNPRNHEFYAGYGVLALNDISLTLNPV